MSEVRDRAAGLHALPSVRSRTGPDKVMQYQLNVVAADIGDMVTGIGGWLFDRAMAGWRVEVAVDRPGDGRALRILGLKAVDPSGPWRSEPDTVAMTAIATDRLDGHPGRDVIVFGPQCPSGLGAPAQSVLYRPSSAALAFKAHALAALGANPAAAGAVETAFRLGPVAGMLAADLVPVS